MVTTGAGGPFEHWLVETAGEEERTLGKDSLSLQYGAAELATVALKGVLDYWPPACSGQCSVWALGLQTGDQQTFWCNPPCRIPHAGAGEPGIELLPSDF